MKILLIDNENEIRQVLKEMILLWSDENHTIYEANGVETGLIAIQQHQPDVLLLDVEMDDGTGFDLLKRISEPMFQLIFTTGHNKYAVQAFKFSAIDYLLKPIDPIELASCLEKASKRVKQHTLQKQLKVMMEQLMDKKPKEAQIVLKDTDKTYFIKVCDILYCIAEGAYTKFIVSDGDPIFMSRNLRVYEEMLAPEGFIRTHHSCLVNPSKIKMYDRKNDSGTLILEGGFTLPVSQRKKEFVLQFLGKKG
ncbi:MAG: response regulator transcription factor [Saprospiraceae bacterium]|nr:response regulator transcription factor [Saprospiraceae bacterium]MBK6566162.1 response regulator transcription factor [Saprospiraceae bacterium]MBK8369819.1 response regulator transcription factor [Saprospiraceae bacterium]MBK9043426.1 response regulator transcription factor [Saprospiraceae bacterium]